MLEKLNGALNMINLKITQHLSSNEVSCPCCGVVFYDKGFVEKLEKLRKYVNKPFYYRSFYRCENKNLQTKGSYKNSLHKKGKAADIYTANWIGSEKLKFVAKAIRLGLSVIAYPSHIHVDNREGQIFLVGEYSK